MSHAGNVSKIRVVYLSYNGFLEPIVSSQVIPYLRELAKRNFEFILLTYEKKKDLKRAGSKKIRAIKDELKKDGIEWRYLKYHKNPRLLSTLYDLLAGAFYTLYLILFKKARIVHARGITPGSMMIFLSGILKVKVIFDMRGRLAEEMAAGGLWREGGLQFRLVKAAERALLKKADAITVLTQRHFEFNKGLDCIKDRNIPKEVIPCCVDMRKFNYDPKISDLKRKLGVEGKFILMYPGKTSTFYHIDDMLDFYKMMSGMIPNSIFYILTTDRTDPLIDRAKLIGIASDNMRIAKDVEFKNMPEYLMMADAGIFFINPYNKLGSSPIKMGEFLASGVPVIINPGVGDTEELVRENRVGVVVRNFDESSYRDAVHELLRLKGEKDDLRKRCRDTAARYLSVEDGVKKYNEIYDILTKDL